MPQLPHLPQQNMAHRLDVVPAYTIGHPALPIPSPASKLVTSGNCVAICKAAKIYSLVGVMQTTFVPGFNDNNMSDKFDKGEDFDYPFKLILH